MRILRFVLTLGIVTSITLPGIPATAAAAGGEIRPAPGKAVPGSYLVVLKRAYTVDSTVTALTNSYGGTVNRVYRRVLNGFAVQTTEEAAKLMAADPAVDYIQQDGYVSTNEIQTNPPSWGLDRVDRNVRILDNSYEYPDGRGAGVRVYVIDSGIRLTHAEFGGRAISGWDFVDNDNNASDCSGHGTHVAGTVGGATFGVAKSATLVSVRVLDCNGSGTMTAVVDGIEWVTDNAIRPAVANMSLGAALAIEPIDTAVANSIASGITYTVSAGNGYPDGVTPMRACDVSPARVPAAITVSGTDSNDRRFYPFNIGTCVDIFAPGMDIRSASNAGDQANVAMSGTSMAAPHVAGAAALLLAGQPNLTPAQVAEQIVNRDATLGVVSIPGDGSPNRLLFVRTWPIRVILTCQVITGSYSCRAETVGAVGAATLAWTPSASGICRIQKTITVTVTATDTIGTSASSSRTFVCRPLCGLLAYEPQCVSDPNPPGLVASAVRRPEQ